MVISSLTTQVKATLRPLPLSSQCPKVSTNLEKEVTVEEEELIHVLLINLNITREEATRASTETKEGSSLITITTITNEATRIATSRTTNSNPFRVIATISSSS